MTLIQLVQLTGRIVECQLYNTWLVLSSFLVIQGRETIFTD